ncbi:hypothetical protein WISP_83625 [Willisornis vidua]|uniref:Uncharacterized protein n=1 Tax=Willisornis vidua TaxID=1566151 RepID=A0ABQ9D885_9PASS|nr:hypothetical protein WISP_83625 [Willisornis vidua]
MHVGSIKVNQFISLNGPQGNGEYKMMVLKSVSYWHIAAIFLNGSLTKDRKLEDNKHNLSRRIFPANVKYTYGQYGGNPIFQAIVETLGQVYKLDKTDILHGNLFCLLCFSVTCAVIVLLVSMCLETNKRKMDKLEHVKR